MGHTVSHSSMRPAEVQIPRGLRGTVLLTWSISRAAAKACGLVAELAGPAVKLEVRLTAPGSQSATIGASVLDADRTIPIESAPRTGAWIEDSIRGVWHLDIDGLIKLTVRESNGSVEALYARTELLAKAGIGGGRYEFDGAALLSP